MTEPREKELEDLKREVDDARRAQSRSEAQAEAAEADRDRVLERMRADFEVSSVEEAKSLLEALDAELDAEMARVRAGLEGSQ